MYTSITTIAVISDTHLPRGARRLADACLRELERAYLTLHGGDFVAASVLEDLAALAPVEAVHGNMEEPALRAALPEERVVEVEGTRIGMVHIPARAPGEKRGSSRVSPVATRSSTATRTFRRSPGRAAS